MCLIATPTYTHADLTELCASYKKAVLLEKPAALCARDALRVKRAVEENGVPYMTAQVVRFWTGYARWEGQPPERLETPETAVSPRQGTGQRGVRGGLRCGLRGRLSFRFRRGLARAIVGLPGVREFHPALQPATRVVQRLPRRVRREFALIDHQNAILDNPCRPPEQRGLVPRKCYNMR